MTFARGLRLELDYLVDVELAGGDFDFNGDVVSFDHLPVSLELLVVMPCCPLVCSTQLMPTSSRFWSVPSRIMRIAPGYALRIAGTCTLYGVRVHILAGARLQYEPYPGFNFLFVDYGTQIHIWVRPSPVHRFAPPCTPHSLADLGSAGQNFGSRAAPWVRNSSPQL